MGIFVEFISISNILFKGIFQIYLLNSKTTILFTSSYIIPDVFPNADLCLVPPDTDIVGGSCLTSKRDPEDDIPNSNSVDAVANVDPPEGAISPGEGPVGLGGCSKIELEPLDGLKGEKGGDADGLYKRPHRDVIVPNTPPADVVWSNLTLPLEEIIVGSDDIVPNADPAEDPNGSSFPAEDAGELDTLDGLEGE